MAENSKNNDPTQTHSDTELWIPPTDTPAWVLNQMPSKEVAVSDLVWKRFHEVRPSWWTEEHGLFEVNQRRRQVYQLWKDGELPEDLQNLE